MVRSVINKGLDLCIPKEADANVDANGSIIPGGAVERTAPDEVAANATAAPVDDPLYIAYNNGDFGQSKLDDYTKNGERVKFVNPPSGIEVEVVIGESQTITAEETILTRDVNGTFRAVAGDGSEEGAGDLLALEGASTGTGEMARIQAEVL